MKNNPFKRDKRSYINQKRLILAPKYILTIFLIKTLNLIGEFQI